MRAVLAIAIKDVKQLVRDRVGFFFVFAFPVLFGVLFGVIFSGASDGPTDVQLAVADLDHSEASTNLVAMLEADPKLAISRFDNVDDAIHAVQRQGRAGALVIPQGFGDKLDALFFGDGAELSLTLDPSKGLETGVIRGSVNASAYQGLFTFFQGGEASQRLVDRSRDELEQSSIDPARRLVISTLLNAVGELDALRNGSDGDEATTDPQGATNDFQPITIKESTLGTGDDEQATSNQPGNAYEITFSQAIAWGLMSCVLGFGLGVVNERTRGTLTRLRLAPISPTQIMLGKATACFITCLAVQIFILAIGVGVFGVRPDSWLLLALSVLCACVCFVGLAMLLASLGKTETGSEGLSRAVLLVLALIGGAGVPLAVMPEWIRHAASISPFKWVIAALDGAIWRQMTFTEIAAPHAILIGIGGIAFALGAIVLRRSLD